MTSSTAPQVRLAHVALSVTDNDRAVKFYTQVLGLREVERPDFGVPGAWLTTGSAMIHLLQVPAVPEPRDPFAHFALNVPTAQVAVLTEAVRAGGGVVRGEPSTRDDFGVAVTAAFCTDTEGNPFEITDGGMTLE
jgi:glyoxylase I family protein